MTITPAELEFCFSLLDHYAGEESKRVHWLADQWTSYGQELSEAEWAKLEDEAAEVIAKYENVRDEADRIASLKLEGVA